MMLVTWFCDLGHRGDWAASPPFHSLATTVDVTVKGDTKLDFTPAKERRDWPFTGGGRAKVNPRSRLGRL
jgi:hypothetical protein